MKKQNLALLAFMTICTITKAQVPGEPQGTLKSEKKGNALSFNSLEEKNLQIEKIQKQIDLRVSLGKTEEELAPRYAELKQTKNALIISNTTKNEK
ncbi:MAG: hypothetical protein H7141_02420 [Burkholderiales bacterium]|nr:hypothetical protein [Bacteroidia bacterium]